MPKCAGCGTETELHELDVPICVTCVTERDRSHQTLATLSAELAAARNLYRQAMEEVAQYEAMLQGLPSGQPDQIVAVRLQEKVKASGDKYWEALLVYSLALQRSKKTPGETEA